MAEQKSRLQQLQDSLYSRQGFTPDDPIVPLSAQPTEAPTHFTQPLEVKQFKPGTPIIKIITGFSVLFFLVALGFAVWLFNTGYNTISANNVAVSVTGPTTVPGGQLLPLQVNIENQNTVAITNVYLVVTYPDGARKTPDARVPLLTERLPVTDINSGSSTIQAIQAAYFGPERTQEKLIISLEYQIANSPGLFSKHKEFFFTLGPAPVSVVFTAPSQTNSGQVITLSADITSNTTVPLTNIAFRLDYPFGFVLSTSTPVADTGNNVWIFGTLQAGEKRHITVRGTLEGQENDSRGFRYSIGIISPDDNQIIATTFLSGANQVLIQKPFIALSLALDGDTAPVHFIRNGSSIATQLSFSNNLPDQISDAKIQVQISGLNADRSKIQVSQGFYQSLTNVISWDQRSVSQLQKLHAGETGQVGFTFGTKPFNGQIQNNQPITVTATVTGLRVTDQNVPTQVAASVSRQVQFLTDVAFSAKLLHSSGPLNNIGTLPPRAEKETDYTVVWSINNTYNNLSSVQVEAILPAYVKFLGVISPSSEAVSYNPINGQIIWNAGMVPAFAGYGQNATRQVAFQIAITPSLSQLNSSPNLITAQQMQGIDSVSNQPISVTVDNLSTAIVSDPGFKSTQGQVK